MIKTYTMHVEGFIPGLPGIWPSGSIVVVDENEQTGELTLVKEEAPVQRELVLPAPAPPEGGEFTGYVNE